jgi:putative transposase
VIPQQVCIGGITTSPDQRWMEQMARNLSLAEVGFLRGCRYLRHDQDAKFCAAFDAILEAVGIKALKLPPLPLASVGPVLAIAGSEI